MYVVTSSSHHASEVGSTQSALPGKSGDPKIGYCFEDDILEDYEQIPHRGILCTFRKQPGQEGSGKLHGALVITPCLVKTSPHQYKRTMNPLGKKRDGGA